MEEKNEMSIRTYAKDEVWCVVALISQNHSHCDHSQSMGPAHKPTIKASDIRTKKRTIDKSGRLTLYK